MDGPRPPFGGPPVYMAFQPVRFTKPSLSPAMLVGSYPTFSPLPPPRGGSAVSLSAALSVAPPSPVMPLPVRKHGALCCPDFPPSHYWKSDGAMHRMSMNSSVSYISSLRDFLLLLASLIYLHRGPTGLSSPLGLYLHLVPTGLSSPLGLADLPTSRPYGTSFSSWPLPTSRPYGNSFSSWPR